MQVLSYHFVPGVALPVAKMYDGQSLPTLLSANSTAHTRAASMLKVGGTAWHGRLLLAG